MAFIDLFAVAKNYDVKQIFSGMDFHLAEGERVAIVGQNGCGKSTLMKIALGTEEPDDGKRVIDRSIQIEMLDQQPPLQVPAASPSNSAISFPMRLQHGRVS